MFGINFVNSRVLRDLRETMTLYKRTLEDVGWTNLALDENASQSLLGLQFDQVLKQSRIYYTRNPLAGLWVNLTTSFVFGEGLPKPKAADKDVQEIIDEFWEDLDNKLTFTSYQAQRLLSDKLQVEGNLYFVLFDDDEGKLKIRILNAVEVKDIVKDEEDRARNLFYKVISRHRKYDFASDAYEINTSIWEYFPDIDIYHLESYKVPENKLRKDARVYHVKVNCDINDKFGIPVLYRGIDWIKAHKEMAGDLATLIKSLSQFAWKKKVKGTQRQINTLQAIMNTKRDLSNVGPVAGSTQIENQGIDLQAMNIPTGGVNIGETGLRQMKLMVCAASGIFEHYFGDPSTSNLATAKTMELPMIKNFLNLQKLWSDIYIRIIKDAIHRKIAIGSFDGSLESDEKNQRFIYNTNKDLTIDTSFPPILEVELKGYAEALQIGKQAGLISSETASLLFLQAANVDNVEEEVRDAMEEKEKNKKEIDNKLNSGVDPATGKPLLDNPNNQPNKDLKKDKKDIKETVDVPTRTPVGRFVKKNNYLTQRMNGYAKTLNVAYRRLYNNISNGIKASGEEGLKVGNVTNLDESLTTFEKDMQTAAKIYYPIAIGIGKAYLQSHLKKPSIKESLFEANGQSQTLLQKKIEWNNKYITTSLIPDMQEKIMNSLRQPYENEAILKTSVNGAVSSFESRIEQYAGAFWTVEEAAVKEAGKGTGLKVNFAGADDGGTCAGCSAAMAGNPYDISEAPEPGTFECDGRCRHALQILNSEGE